MTRRGLQGTVRVLRRRLGLPVPLPWHVRLLRALWQPDRVQR